VKIHDFTPKIIFSPIVGDCCLSPNEQFSDISCRAYERGATIGENMIFGVKS
jgi:hypothetical protein